MDYLKNSIFFYMRHVGGVKEALYVHAIAILLSHAHSFLRSVVENRYEHAIYLLDELGICTRSHVHFFRKVLYLGKFE